MLGTFKTTKSQQRTTTHGTAHFKAILNTEHKLSSPRNFLEVLQLNANGICNKTDEI